MYPFNAHYSFYTGGSVLGTLERLAPKLTRLNDYLNVIYIYYVCCFYKTLKVLLNLHDNMTGIVMYTALS